jgi:hypothetical protein
MIKFSSLSTGLPFVMGTCLSTLVLAPVLAPVAIADPAPETVFEFEAMPAFEPIPASAPVSNPNYVNLPGQITPDARPMRFNPQPFANMETITLSEDEKKIPKPRNIVEEANAGTPRSESYNSGFKIRLDQMGDTPTE